MKIYLNITNKLLKIYYYLILLIHNILNTYSDMDN